MSKNDSIEIGAGISRSDADKYPDQIFLIDIGPGPDEGVVWCDCAAPGQDMDPGDAVVYVRIDTAAAIQQPESEPLDVESLIDIFDTAASRQPNKLGAGVIAVADAVRRESPQPSAQVPNEQGKNRYGLDMSYFRNLINRELNRPLTDFRPDEFARVCARMAATADREVLQESEFGRKQSSAQVPEQPTAEMFDAGEEALAKGLRYMSEAHCEIVYNVWTAMRAAAPSIAEKREWPPLAKRHEGMKISANGVLRRVSGTLKFGARQMLTHLQETASRYYSGDVAAVDEFLQLYCLDDKRPEPPEVPKNRSCCCGETDDAWRLCPEHGPSSEPPIAIDSTHLDCPVCEGEFSDSCSNCSPTDEPPEVSE